MSAAAIALVLTALTAPAFAGKRPPIVVAVDQGDAAKLARLLKKAKPRDVDAFDGDVRSPTAGMRAIEVAAKKGDLAATDALLAAGAEATAKALEHAATGGHVEIAQRLVERGAPRADLALTAAAKAGHAPLVEWLLPHARKADRFFNLNQVLEFAIYFPKTPSAEVVKLLLREKADPRIGWGPGKHTPLHMAIAKGAYDVVDVLLDGGAPLDAQDSRGFTPLLTAVSGAHHALVDRLLARGADPRHVATRGETVLHLLLAVPPDEGAIAAKTVLERFLAAKVPVDHAGKDGVTALMAAAGAGSVPWVELLLARGAKLQARTADGRAAIDFALACGQGRGPHGLTRPTACHGDVAVRLLADARAPIPARDGRGRTLLVRAILSGNEPLVLHVLSRRGADLARDHEESGPLHYAAVFGSPAVMKALLDRAALDFQKPAAVAKLVNLANARGETPLALAQGAGRDDIAALLVAAGAK